MSTVSKSTSVHYQNGSYFIDGLHIKKHGKVTISSRDFACDVGFRPPSLLSKVPANPVHIDKGGNISIQVGDSPGTLFVTVTGSQTYAAASSSTVQGVVDSGGVKQGGPNQIVID